MEKQIMKLQDSTVQDVADLNIGGDNRMLEVTINIKLGYERYRLAKKKQNRVYGKNQEIPMNIKK